MPTIDDNLTALAPSTPYTPDAVRHANGAPLFDPDLWPLRTWGRYIVNRNNERVKWACINWHGAYLTSHVVGGLESWPLDALTARIAQLGFNCVRLPYSTQGVLENPVVNASAVAANPQYVGKRMLELFDEAVASMEKAGLMVIINNHNSKSGWCCSSDSEEGLWYTPEYSEEQWLRSLTILAARYRGNKHVVGFDIRNEPHDYGSVNLGWGTGDPDTEDWAAAAQRAGNAILIENPDVLIIVEGLCLAKEFRPLHRHQIELDMPHRLVYSVHMYHFFQLFTAFNEQVMSWHGAQVMAKIALFFVIVMIAILLRFWVRLAYPLPSRGVVITTAGAWAVFICFCFVVYNIIFFIQLANFAACNWQATNDILPLMIISIVLLVFAAVVLAYGIYKVHSDDEGDGHGYSDDAREMRHLETEPDFVDLPGESEDEEGEDDGQRNCCCSAPGWRSARLAWELRVSKPPVWDCGLCFGFQLFVFLAIAVVLLTLTNFFARSFLDYEWFERHMDGTWGFVLMSGYPWTAPIWVSEFGASARGDFWLKMMRYLSARDVDWAYWPLNPLKRTNREQVGLGWVDVAPRWEEDPWGFLAEDFMKVRYPWMLNDLRAIMQSPASWTPEDYPCDRTAVSAECGG